MSERESLLEKKEPATCSPGGTGFRFFVLFFISAICFGNYFAYDEIQPLERNFQDVCFF